MVMNNRQNRREQGLTLLEYAVGAAVLAGIVVGAMTTFGQGLQTYFQNLNEWMSAQQIQSS